MVFLAGLIGRLWLADIGTRRGYIWDHFDSISRGLTAQKHGLLNIYTLGLEDLIVVPGKVYRNGQSVQVNRRGITVFNYPPMAPTLLWLQSKILPEPIEANTLVARLIMSSFAMLGELLTAVGVALIAWNLFGRKAGLWAGSLCWLLPALAMNSTFWGQVDGLMLAPATFLVWFMLRRRWLAAGLSLAIACLLKPQGLILAPIALFAAVVMPAVEQKVDFGRIFRRLVKLGAAFAAAVVILTLPWTITSGAEWLKRSYYFSFVEAFPYTTLKGFNIWYLDALIQDGKLIDTPLVLKDRMIPGALNSRAIVGGLTKDAWGRVLTMLAMAAFAALCWWRYRRRPIAVVVFSALWLWSVFMLPTRVHERFIVYCIPFMLVVAVAFRRLWPAVVVLIIVGTAAHSWTIWLKGPPAGTFNPKPAYARYRQNYEQRYGNLPAYQRPRLPEYHQFAEALGRNYLQARKKAQTREYLVTLLSLLSYGWATIAMFVKPPLTRVPKGALSRHR